MKTLDLECLWDMQSTPHASWVLRCTLYCPMLEGFDFRA